ncbi:MAG: choice-of-anchor tandem repeat GloVer-containing protein [Tepidisphaeraceae bacterium]
MPIWKSLGNRALLFAILAVGPAMPAVAQYTLTTLASFPGITGSASGGLVADAFGNLYGASLAGGSGNAGTVVELAKGSSSITILANFNWIDGAYPSAPLIVDASGNLFGTTGNGGATYNFGKSYGDGTIFEMAKGSSSITMLASFTGGNGDGPGSLIADAAGNLYGTTGLGGAHGDGTVFELAKGSTNITTLASFSNTNGGGPLVADAAGNLFGTTYAGGTSGDGTVFELAKGSSSITTLASFDDSNGRNPLVGLSTDGAGNLYGTTEYGGVNDDGTVFEIAKESSSINTLVSFNGSDGYAPYAGVIADASGNLFGSTSRGGDSFYGNVFELAKGASGVTTLASFDLDNGAIPLGTLISDASGDLYGVTGNSGPETAFGTIFELSPTSVPEPASFSLVVFASLSLTARRRRG